MRQVIMYRGEDDYWLAECPSLKGCNTQGKTKEEAIANIKEAIELYLETLTESEKQNLTTREILTTSYEVTVA